MDSAKASRLQFRDAVRTDWRKLAAACVFTAAILAIAQRAPAETLPSLRAVHALTVVTEAPFLSVGKLVYAVGALLVVMIAAFWIWALSRTVHQQSDALRARADAQASMERRNTQLEHRRSQIIEDMNSSRSLQELIEEIAELVSFSLNGVYCWCEMKDGAQIGQMPMAGELRTLRRDIPSRNGGSLGTLFLAIEPAVKAGEEESVALASGARLATLAIETRSLYKDLAYRSEFDLLTDIYNRLSLERYLEEQIKKAREEESVFGLIYIDLDDFKHVNDRYGHHVGDLYLQEVSLRMKRQLRSGDMLARLGGDEFGALIPVVRSHTAAEEIAQRLERSFDAPFAVEGYILRGAASVGVALYPEDGTTAEGLLSAADAAMYVAKLTKRSAADTPGKLQKALFRPEE